MIKKIKIKGFKSIRELELNLEPINILIGANGVGKSNFISFFKLVNNIYEQRLGNYSLRAGVDNLLHYGLKNTNEIWGLIRFRNNGYSFVLQHGVDLDGKFFIKSERSIDDSALDKNIFSNSDVKESLVKDSNAIRDKYLKERLQNYKIYHFHDTSISAPLRTDCQINDNRYLKEDGDNLPAFLYYLQQIHPKTFHRIEKVISYVVPYFEKFNLAPDANDKNSIRLQWNEINHPEKYFDATHLSDGSLRFIALATLLMQPNLPKIIIIDEPELGLHPTSITKLVGLIKSASSQDCQIIVSTQSVNLVDNFAPADIITVDKDDNQSIFNRLDEKKLKDWLEDYSLGDLWVKSVIDGQPL